MNANTEINKQDEKNSVIEQVCAENNLRTMRQNKDLSWSVGSTSGNTYNVDCKSRLDRDGCMHFEWVCDCLARVEHCRHVNAVIDVVERQMNEFDQAFDR